MNYRRASWRMLRLLVTIAAVVLLLAVVGHFFGEVGKLVLLGIALATVFVLEAAS